MFCHLSLALHPVSLLEFNLAIHCHVPSIILKTMSSQQRDCAWLSDHMQLLMRRTTVVDRMLRSQSSSVPPCSGDIHQGQRVCTSSVMICSSGSSRLFWTRWSSMDMKSVNLWPLKVLQLQPRQHTSLAYQQFRISVNHFYLYHVSS